MNELQRNRVIDRIKAWTKCREIKKWHQFHLPERVRESFPEEVTIELGVEREVGGSRQMWLVE